MLAKKLFIPSQMQTLYGFPRSCDLVRPFFLFFFLFNGSRKHLSFQCCVTKYRLFNFNFFYLCVPAIKIGVGTPLYRYPNAVRSTDGLKMCTSCAQYYYYFVF